MQLDHYIRIGGGLNFKLWPIPFFDITKKYGIYIRIRAFYPGCFYHGAEQPKNQ